MEDSVLVLSSPADPNAGHHPRRPGWRIQPRSGINVGDPTAVNAAHAAAVGGGLRSVYPLTARRGRASLRRPGTPAGAIVNVLAHLS